MGDKSPKAKARAKKQDLRMKAQKRREAESKIHRPPTDAGEAAPKAS